MKHWLRLLWNDGLFSPRGLLVRAGILAACYLIAHFLGGREYAGFLSGTVATTGSAIPIETYLGMLYVLLHFSFVLVVPILILAAGFLKLGLRLWKPAGGNK